MSSKAPDELNLRMSARVDDVRGMVVQFLDRAYRAGHFRVFIIHGKGQGGDGTGPVRRETLRLLRNDAAFGSMSTNSTSPSRPRRGRRGASQPAPLAPRPAYLLDSRPRE